jgi:phosphoribosylamine--glycine ligase
MKILVIGSGGREHTIAWKLAQSPLLSELYIAPGNGGTRSLGENIDVDISDHDALKEIVKEHSIDLTIVGPEQPLVDGIVDAFQMENLSIFGPRQSAARLEGSKAFSKDFMERHHIPTGRSKTFEDAEPAIAYVRGIGAPIVVKASGLAAGKGVIVCETEEHAVQAIEQIMVNREFGQAGNQVVIEEFLQGEELSVIAITDGENYQLLAPSQDHKPAYDGDKGPNTGGMGAYAPAPAATDELISSVKASIIEPTLKGMAEEKTPYVGFLYFGLMLTTDGPKVLEYNCRLGDPETQVILPLMKSDLLGVIQAVMHGELHETPVQLYDGYATCVVAASGGYPGAYEKGKEITGLDDISDEYVQVFHAGTAVKGNMVVTNGGRVLAVNCFGDTLPESVERAYAELKKIHFDDMHYRTDIAQKGIDRL